MERNIPPIPFIVPRYHPTGNLDSDNSKYKIKFYLDTIYHYTKVETAKKIIEGHKLWFSSPSTFNDPFDMHEGLIDYSATKQQSRSWLRTQIPGISRQDIRRGTRPQKNSRSIFEASGRDILVEMKEEVGVCCFSKTSHGSLMWSHYADSHKGVCFGFNIDPIHLDSKTYFSVGEVTYMEKIIPLNSANDETSVLPYWIYTKSHIWSYEQEVRALIKNRHGVNLFDFEKACLIEVFFGCRTSKKEIDEILTLLKANGYNVKKKRMVIDELTFDIKAVDF